MEQVIDDGIVELTKMLIKQDIKDKETSIEYVTIRKTDLIKHSIDLLKLLKKY